MSSTIEVRTMSPAVEQTIIECGEPFSPERTAQIVADFRRDGFALIRDVLNADEVAALKNGCDCVFEDPKYIASENRYNEIIGVRLFEIDPIFQDMLTREPIISLVENILGPDCHLIAQNIVRNLPGQAIDSYHADDLVILPVGEGMERHDPRLTMPVFLLTIQIPLTDIPSEEYGPTQFIPCSHYSGRQPNDPKQPNFEGREPVSILCKAGDIYLHNGQCWHRGAPNTSDTTRYLLQQAYGMRWVSQRFYPFLNYRMPQHVIDRADERGLRVLGAHPKSAYG